MHAFYVFMLSSLALATSARKAKPQAKVIKNNVYMQLAEEASNKAAAALIEEEDKAREKKKTLQANKNTANQPKSSKNKKNNNIIISKGTKIDSADELAEGVNNMNVESSDDEETETATSQKKADKEEERIPSIPFLITTQVQVSQWCIDIYLQKLKNGLKVPAKTSWLNVMSHPNFGNLTRNAAPVVARCAKIVTARNHLLHNWEDPESLIGFSSGLTADQITRMETVIGHDGGDYLSDLLTYNTHNPLDNTSKTNIAMCPTPMNSQTTVILLSLNALCRSVNGQLSMELRGYCDTIRERRNAYAHPPTLCYKEAQAMLAQLPPNGYVY